MKVAPGNNPSFPRIIPVVHWIMLEQVGITIDPQKMCKTFNMLREESVWQREVLYKQAADNNKQ